MLVVSKPENGAGNNFLPAGERINPAENGADRGGIAAPAAAPVAAPNPPAAHRHSTAGSAAGGAQNSSNSVCIHSVWRSKPKLSQTSFPREASVFPGSAHMWRRRRADASAS